MACAAISVPVVVTLMMSLVVMTMRATLLDFCLLICRKRSSVRIVPSVIKKILLACSILLGCGTVAPRLPGGMKQVLTFVSSLQKSIALLVYSVPLSRVIDVVRLSDPRIVRPVCP